MSRTCNLYRLTKH